MLVTDNIKAKMNHLGGSRIPFLFIIDFEFKNPIIISIDEIDNNEILYDIKGFSNHSELRMPDKDLKLEKYPIPFETYQTVFNRVQYHIKNGETYLLNLTFPTRIDCSYTLKDIYAVSKAKFKLFYKEKFVVFSPEIFVEIEDNQIASYPMKGTIDAAIPNAEKIILSDEKEEAEHITMVDLIRNDLSIVAKNVHIEKFRYIDLIKTNDKELLQVSSKIVGLLEPDFHKKIGDIIFSLLPAGSITGAPKKRTVEIIKTVENYERGYYTGIFGYFDGKYLKSAVMIRFIENINGELYYKSGGGITYMSDAKSEYEEMINKVYVPVA